MPRLFGSDQWDGPWSDFPDFSVRWSLWCDRKSRVPRLGSWSNPGFSKGLGFILIRTCFMDDSSRLLLVLLIELAEQWTGEPSAKHIIIWIGRNSLLDRFRFRILNVRSPPPFREARYRRAYRSLSFASKYSLESSSPTRCTYFCTALKILGNNRRTIAISAENFACLCNMYIICFSSQCWRTCMGIINYSTEFVDIL